MFSSLDEAALLQVPPSGSEWLTQKQFWMDVLSVLSKFVVKYMGSIHSSVEDQLDALVQDIEVESVARRTSTEPLLALLELILACAVHCKLKENCVMQVLQLRKDQQTAMMASIQRFKAKHQKAKISSTSSTTASSSSSDADLKSRYASLKQAKDSVSTQLQQAQKSNSALTDRNNELVTLVTQLEEQLASMSTDYKTMKVQFEALSQKDQKAIGELDLTSPLRFMASSKVASEENTHLRSTVATQEKTISSLQTQLNGLSPYVSKVRELEDEIEMLKEKSRSADQVERVTRKFEAKSAELSNALVKVKQLEETLEQTQKTSAEHEAVARQVPQLKSKLDQYKTEMVSLHSKLTDASSRSSNSEVTSLHEKLQAYALQCEQHASIVADLEREKDSLVQALKVKSAREPSSAAPKQSLASEARGSLQHLVVGKKSNEAQALLEKELSAAKEAVETVKLDLEDQLDTMSRLKEKFQSDYITCSEQLRTANTEIADLNKRIALQDQSLAQSKEQAASLSAERTTLQTSVSTLSEKLSALETQKSQLETSLKSLEETLVQTDSEKTALSAERTSLLTTAADLKDTISKHEAKISSLESGEKKFAELENLHARETAALTARLGEIQAELEQTAEESLKIASETELVKAELSEAQIRLEELSTESATQQDQCQSLSSELDEIKHLKAELEGQVANMEMEQSELSETLQEYMNRELAAVESSLSLQNEVENLNSLIESRDAELTTMQQELEKAKANEELISVIGALRAQVVSQQKTITAQKDETSAIVVSYHRLGMELLQYKIGGVPQPQSTTTTTFAPLSSPRRATIASKPAFRASPKKTMGKTSPNSKLTPSKRVPLREKQLNHLFNQGLQLPASACAADTASKGRRLTMAQKALESRPRSTLSTAALAKR